MKKTLIESGIEDRPDHNCDAMVLDSICALWSKAHIVPINGNTQAHYSACANDDVASHEHFCVCGGGGAGGAYTCRGPANALCAKSKSGYMDGELYLLWFEKVVLKYCSLDKPVILIQDGHKSHMTLSIVETVHRGNVVLFNLPPRRTHATQPLDKSMFKALKAAFGTALKSVTFAR